MKILFAICIFVMFGAPAFTKEKTPEELANFILKKRIASCYRYGNKIPKDDMFLLELDVNMYQAAFDGKDVKLKVLIAIKALHAMACEVYNAEHVEKVISKEEREKEVRIRLMKDPHYQKLKAWCFERYRSEQATSNNDAHDPAAAGHGK